MTIDLRKEEPMNNVNRILAIESLVKYYDINIVEQIDPRVIHSWTELDDKDQETEVKQIDLAYVLFGLPTVELRHLMTKLSQHAFENKILPVDNLNPEAEPEIPMTNREKLRKEAEERMKQSQVTEAQSGTVIEEEIKE
jgi:hypothetical protein